MPMLSLQTLLSFSDQLNDAEHQEMIAKRIAVDQYASQLLVRLDFVKKAPRLEAPDVFDPEVQPNVNLVAEYLDHQLQNPEMIHHYEKSCFESDQLLAEIGCCYEILNHRLSIPINPPKNCRHRLYYIPMQDATTEQITEQMQDITTEQNESSPDLTQNNSLANSLQSPESTKSPKSTKEKETDFQDLKKESRSPVQTKDSKQKNSETPSNILNDLNFESNESTRKFDLKPKFSVARFLCKQIVAASFVLIIVYCWTNGSRWNLGNFWKVEPDQTSQEDILESEIMDHVESNVIRPSIISTSNIKNMPVITVDELRQIQKESSSNKNDQAIKSSEEQESIIDFDATDSTVSNKTALNSSTTTPNANLPATDSSVPLTAPENNRF